MKNPQVKRFKGLNNIEDPVRLGLQWLVIAKNVLVTATGSLMRRFGYAKKYSGVNLAGAYSTRDFKRCYVVDNGALLRVYPDMTVAVLRTGLSSRPMYWTEVNGVVYFANGAERGIITTNDAVQAWDWPVPDAPNVAAMTGKLDAGQYQVICTYVLPDGRETGAGPSTAIILQDGQALQITNIPLQAGLKTRVYIAPANSTVFQLAFETTRSTSTTWNSAPEWLGIELVTNFMDPPPAAGTMPVFWRGKMHLVEHFPAHDQSVIWPSEPLGFHLFDLNDSFIPVPGKVLMLAAQKDALIIGTDRAIYAFDDDKLTQLADYGVVKGRHWAVEQHTEDIDRIVFWSQRGACRAMPFENLTEGQISVNCGLTAGGTIVHKDGQMHYIVALQKGGDAFNPRSET